MKTETKEEMLTNWFGWIERRLKSQGLIAIKTGMKGLYEQIESQQSSEIERLKEENDKKCIEFVDWIDSDNAILLETHSENKKWIYKGERHTTQELLNLFNNRSR